MKGDILNMKISITPLKSRSQPVIAGIIFLLSYVPALFWMWDRWFTRDSYYSHGILIPFVTAFLIWQKKDELKIIAPQRSGWGLPLIVIGVLIHLMSSLLRIYFSSGFSMLIVLVGLILHFYGSAILKKIIFPIAFLFFMIPLPLVVIVNISFKMKLFAADIAAKLLNYMGLLAVREGSIIQMRHAYVIVDDVCSGLRSLISLAALGSIFAYWLNGAMYKRIFLFVSTIPIAIVTNVCRVVLLASISEIWGPPYATGWIHDVSGFFVFALAFVLLYVVGKLIE